SGKSEVCRILSERGAEVVSSDQIAHQLLDPRTEYGEKIIDHFGDGILIEDKIDRGRLAKLVFSNRSELEFLEKTLHPPILEEIENQYQKSKSKLFVAEVPLLFELGWESYFDQTLLVVSKNRVHEERLFRFMPDEKKRRLADIVIENFGTIEELTQTILKY
ncbi:MAG: dephospho-CoA kinase, partial [Chlamydiae bacterium]|nr:dephospho-CoA kinase [Chlamydiota bacterium]